MASTSTLSSRPIALDGPLLRTVPLHLQAANGGSSPRGDPMDTSPGGPSLSNSYMTSTSSGSIMTEILPNGGAAQPSGAAAAAQQPKVVQTAFIHKLYNMLEDQTISHLITWSSSNDSFLISPSADFSKVLATYFKHTNVSSFVRQLNMYGFHKVSDVFHSGAPESPLWEFKHGAGNFRRGDFAGLKEIKRRASRHTLIHRDSFSSSLSKPPPLPMGPPGVNEIQETPETRLNMLEQTLYELHSRLARTEEANTALNTKCHTLSGNLIKSFQYNHDLSSVILNMIGDPDRQLHRDVQSMQIDISRHLDALRSQETLQQPEVRARHPSFAQPQPEPGPPMSPFQLAQDDQRRGSLFTTPRQGFFRPPFPHRNTAESTIRRPELGTIRGATPPPRSDLPSSSCEPPTSPTTADHASGQESSHSTTLSPPSYLSRRHTSADIRPQVPQGWRSAVGSNEHLPLTAQQHQSPFASGTSSSAWPSSPHRTPNSNTGEQQLRDSLARYQLSTNEGRMPGHGAGGFNPPISSGNIHGVHQTLGSRNSTPPSSSIAAEIMNGMHISTSSGHHQTHSGGADSAPSWSFTGARLPFKDAFASGPPTRRGSVAHLLNPAETAERDEEDDIGPDELRKRKRLI